MGRMNALGMAEQVSEGNISLDGAIEYHLTANHYPPVPRSMVQPCLDAIAAFEEEEYDREITLPEGVSYRDSKTAPASAIVEQHHLDSFLTQEEE